MKIFDIDAHPPIDIRQRRRFFNLLSSLGISGICGTVSADGITDEKCALALNEAALRLAEDEPSYIPALWGFPGLLEKITGAGLICVDTSIRDELGDITGYAEMSGIPVCLCHETPESASLILEKFPRALIIAGGNWSSGFDPLKSVEMLEKYPNFYLSLSAGVWTVNYVLHELIHRMPTDRLLFGTGFPYTNPSSKLAAIKWELRDTNNETRERVFYKNACELFGGLMI